MDTNKDVQFIIETAIVVLIENLQPDEHIKDDGSHFRLRIGEEPRAGKVQDEGCGHLEEGLTNDHLPHCEADDGSGAGSRRSVEDFVCGWVGGERQRGEGVPLKESVSKMMYRRGEEADLHKEIDPEELNGGKNGPHIGVLHRCHECDYHGGDVDCDLKLEKLLHSVVHSTAPHQGC